MTASKWFIWLLADAKSPMDGKAPYAFKEKRVVEGNNDEDVWLVLRDKAAKEEPEMTLMDVYALPTEFYDERTAEHMRMAMEMGALKMRMANWRAV